MNILIRKLLIIMNNIMNNILIIKELLDSNKKLMEGVLGVTEDIPSEQKERVLKNIDNMNDLIFEAVEQTIKHEQIKILHDITKE